MYEYMQRRSKLNNEQFQKVVEQSNSEEMVAQFKTIFQVAREEGVTKGRDEAMRFAIKSLVGKTRLSDTIIALTLNVSIELVKAIRGEVKAEKLAAAKKAAALKKTPKPKTPKP